MYQHLCDELPDQCMECKTKGCNCHTRWMPHLNSTDKEMSVNAMKSNATSTNSRPSHPITNANSRPPHLIPANLTLANATSTNFTSGNSTFGHNRPNSTLTHKPHSNHAARNIFNIATIIGVMLISFQQI